MSPLSLNADVCNIKPTSKLVVTKGTPYTVNVKTSTGAKL